MASYSLSKVSRNVTMTGIFSAADFTSWTSCASADHDSERLNSVADDEAKKKPKKVNPFDCFSPVCRLSKVDLLRSSLSRKYSTKAVPDSDDAAKLIGATVISSKAPSSSASLSNSVTETENDKTEFKALSEAEIVSECPLDKEELGRSTWGLLHTIAAYYPASPSDVDKENALNFVKSLSYLYPCEVCREDFKESVAKAPPRYVSDVLANAILSHLRTIIKVINICCD